MKRHGKSLKRSLRSLRAEEFHRSWETKIMCWWRYRHMQPQALVFWKFIVIYVCYSSSSSFTRTESPYKWDDHSSSIATYAPDVITLLALKQSLGSPTNPLLETWNLTAPLCSWKGVEWSHQSSYPFNCQEESFTQAFTYATDLDATVTSLVLDSAGLSGTLNSAISKLYELKELVLGHNKLTGPIPGELGNSPSLTIVSLEHNQLTGMIPATIWNLCRNTKLSTLLLHDNNLSGPIPQPLGGSGTMCLQLTSLSLGNNSLSGIIPPFIGNFANLSWLDLSNNKLTYVIPSNFANLTNLSVETDHGFSVAGNRLMGPIPPFKESFNPGAFERNSPWLCGPPLTTPCVHDLALTTHQHHKAGMNPTSIILLIAAIVVCTVLLFYGFFQVNRLSAWKLMLKKMRLLPEERSFNDEAKFPQGKLVQFCESGAGTLSEDTMLKSASELMEETKYGKIYRTWLPSKQMLSLYLFREDLARDEPEFLQGVLRLAVINHPNLVPLRAYYLSRKNEKLLIFDHVLRKTLTDTIHGECTLNWPQRHKIALGIAHGLVHLHLESPRPLVHANLKSSTILVDGHLNALLTGYGLHLLVAPAAANMVVLDAANEGYKAPELRKSMRLSVQIDVFSYGIILLEILTRKNPGSFPRTDGKVDLPELVKTAILEERLSDVLDMELMKPSECTPTKNGLVEALRLGIACCARSPSLRPTIAEVVQKLEDIQSKFLKQGLHQDTL